jgi:hypothetical protein
VSQLYPQWDAGLPLPSQTIQFAALVALLEGEMAASAATAAEPFMERAYARDRTRLLAGRHAAGLDASEIPLLPELEPKPELEPVVTLSDLIRTCASPMQYIAGHRLFHSEVPWKRSARSSFALQNDFGNHRRGHHW